MVIAYVHFCGYLKSTVDRLYADCLFSVGYCFKVLLVYFPKHLHHIPAHCEWGCQHPCQCLLSLTLFSPAYYIYMVMVYMCVIMYMSAHHSAHVEVRGKLSVIQAWYSLVCSHCSSQIIDTKTDYVYSQVLSTVTAQLLRNSNPLSCLLLSHMVFTFSLSSVPCVSSWQMPWWSAHHSASCALCLTAISFLPPPTPFRPSPWEQKFSHRRIGSLLNNKITGEPSLCERYWSRRWFSSHDSASSWTGTRSLASEVSIWIHSAQDQPRQRCGVMSLLSLVWVLGMELRSLGLHSKHLNLLSQLASPFHHF
jgi:hypothetical protein